MMARAGYKRRICIDDLVFLPKTSGDVLIRSAAECP